MEEKDEELTEPEAAAVIIDAIEAADEMAPLRCCALLVNTAISRMVSLMRSVGLPDLVEDDGRLDGNITAFLVRVLFSPRILQPKDALAVFPDAIKMLVTARRLYLRKLGRDYATELNDADGVMDGEVETWRRRSADEESLAMIHTLAVMIEVAGYGEREADRRKRLARLLVAIDQSAGACPDLRTDAGRELAMGVVAKLRDAIDDVERHARAVKTSLSEDELRDLGLA